MPLTQVLDYAHDTTGICVIGGYIYHGTADFSDLDGLYVFGDCFGPESGDFSGRIFTLHYENGSWLPISRISPLNCFLQNVGVLHSEAVLLLN